MKKFFSTLFIFSALSVMQLGYAADLQRQGDDLMMAIHREDTKRAQKQERVPQKTSQPSQWLTWFTSLRKPTRKNFLQAKQYVNSKWRCLRHGEGCSQKERNILRTLAVASGIAVAGGIHTGYRKWNPRKIDYTQLNPDEQQSIRDAFYDELSPTIGMVNNQNIADLFKQYRMPTDFMNMYLKDVVRGHSPELVRIVLENGADPSYLFTPWEAAKLTMLSAAIQRSAGEKREIENSEQILKILLDKGARIDSQKSEGDFTALMWAVNNNLPTLAQILLDYGADITLTNKDGETAYDIAVKKGIQDRFPTSLQPR